LRVRRWTFGFLRHGVSKLVNSSKSHHCRRRRYDTGQTTYSLSATGVKAAGCKSSVYWAQFSYVPRSWNTLLGTQPGVGCLGIH
jgi:hypothetical protein